MDVLPIVNPWKCPAVPLNHIFENLAEAPPSGRAVTFLNKAILASFEPIKNCPNFLLRVCRKDFADSPRFSNRVLLIPVLLILLSKISPERDRFKECLDVGQNL